MSDQPTYTIFVVSDSTGETAMTMTRAALVQFQDCDPNIVRCKNIRTADQVQAILDQASETRGLIIYTIASESLRSKILDECSGKGIPAVDLLGPMLTELKSYFGVSSSEGEGLLRVVNEKYYRRIEAIEYTVKHDDGKLLTDLDDADIVLVGISRTSKTPLSIFLSHKGWKVANIPLVLNTPPPEEVFEIDQRKIVALSIDEEILRKIRRNRLEKFGQDPGGEYASFEHILKEVDYAMDLFKKNRRWPVLNVSDKALEETAAEITKIVSQRMGYPTDLIF